jgi:putative transposase
MQTVTELGRRLGVAATCAALGVVRASYYRSRKPRPEPRRRPSPARALPPAERQAVLEVLHQPRFVDLAPAEIYATLLDDGRYLCSERTFYRVLAAHAEIRERRDQLRHPHYAAPELLATRPNQLWSWDITKLLGPTTWTYFYLYVLLDVFSRYVVGWLLALCESARLAEQLIAESCERQGIVPGQLTVHADRGPAMTSKPVALLLADLGVTKSHSRPHVSNDNPFSESQFKTLKYRPDFPERFGSLEYGRSFCRDFFGWYNTEHHHVGLGLFTPHDVHYGLAEAKHAQRARVLAEAFARHPERFPRGLPQPRAVPSAVWINPPANRGVVPAGETTMTWESREVAIVVPGATVEVVSECERPQSPNLTPEDRCVPAAPANRVGPAKRESTLTQESRAVEIVDPGASCEAVPGADRPESPHLISEDLCMAVAQ